MNEVEGQYPEGPGWIYVSVWPWIKTWGLILYDKLKPIRLWAYENQHTVDIMALLFCLWVLLASVRLYKRHRRNKLRLWIGATMPKGDRKKYLQHYYAEGYHDFLFDSFCDNKISAQEYRAELERLGREHDLPDLLRKKVSKPAIAHRIRTNVEAMGKSLALYKKPKIPGDPPKQEVEENTFVKDFGSQFLDRVKPKA